MGDLSRLRAGGPALILVLASCSNEAPAPRAVGAEAQQARAIELVAERLSGVQAYAYGVTRFIDGERWLVAAEPQPPRSGLTLFGIVDLDRGSVDLSAR